MNPALAWLPTSISNLFRFQNIIIIAFAILFAIAIAIACHFHWQFGHYKRSNRRNENEINRPPVSHDRSAEEPVREEPPLTYRLRGVSAASEKPDILALLQKAWTIPESTKLTVHSLSTNPFRPEQKIATISFSETPEFLLSTKHDEWIAAINDETELLLDKHFRGFTPLHSDPDADCILDCIAVHDLGGHPFGSFKSRDRSFMWLRDGLRRDLPQARIFVYGYDAKLVNSKSAESVTDLGIELQGAIHQIRTGKDATNQNRHLGFSDARQISPKPLVLIGHGLGGLVIKQAIINMYGSETEDDQTALSAMRATLFFAVPSLGMNIKSLIPVVQGCRNEDLVKSLKSTSEMLRRQKSPFDRASRPFFRYWYYETMESPTAEKVGSKWSMTGPEEMLVDPHSATNGHAHSEPNGHFVQPINRNHYDVVKFPHREDRYYLMVSEHLKRIKKEIPNTKGNGRNVNQRQVLFEMGRLIENREKANEFDGLTVESV